MLKTLEMSSIVSNIYQFIGRRSSTWALVLITGGMAFEVVFDRGIEKVVDTVGKGKVWKDVKLTVPPLQEVEEE